MNSVQLAGAIAVAVAIAGPAAAQNTTVFRQQPAQGGGQAAARRATSVTPPAQPTYQQPSSPWVGPSYPAYPVAYTVLPAVIMSDGSVYASLGGGYVPVRQACAVQYSQQQVTPPRVINGNDLLWSGGNPMTTTQPAPAQVTPSQQMVRAAQGQRAPAVQTQPGLASACYRMDPYGPVVIVR